MEYITPVMMGIEDMLNYIQDYGVSVVIVAIFLYAVIKVLNAIFKYVDNKLGNRKHDKLINLRNQVGEEIQVLLDEFLAAHKGDRIRVIEFSNSVISVAYLPFKYMTCTYESCRFGKSAIGHKIDRMSTSLFTPFLKYLKDNEYCILDSRNRLDHMGGAVYDLMVTVHEEKSLCIELNTGRKSKAIGYLSFQKDEGFTDDDCKDIKYLSQQVSALLGVMDN